MSKVLFLIDCQNDFIHPDGALCVKGADQDMVRLAKFIRDNVMDIDHIVLTIDTHQPLDISHPLMWTDSKGEHPKPIETVITVKDMEERKWIPTENPRMCLQFLKKLEDIGGYQHRIWPEHCLEHSWGAAIDARIMDALKYWTHSRQRRYTTVQKGLYQFAEHYGAFQANVNLGVPETEFNSRLMIDLISYDTIYIAGEAKSHCVASTLAQMLDWSPRCAEKIIILSDCMSDVEGLGFLGTSIFNRAQELGVATLTTKEITSDQGGIGTWGSNTQTFG